MPEPIAIVLDTPDGPVSVPLKAGSWSGSGHRASVELDGQRYVIHVDSTRT